MKRWLGALLACAWLAIGTIARADPIRILVAASHARGAPGELPLQHAAEDARHVKDALVALGGFRASDAIVLDDPTIAELDAALARARSLAQGHAEGEVTFVFYFSGHGDRDRIHLGGETLAIADLAARVRAVPAGLRILVTDACRNYPTRMKGITTEPGFAIAPSPANAASGVVWLFASGDGEPAQESDELHGALFTHYWVSALRGAGDANGDGRVTVAESYDFAFAQTLLRSARGSGVLQHPAAVFDLREAAPIVLTSTIDGATAVRFPRAADVHYLVYALGARAVLGEIWGAEDREATLALPPGRYLVARRASSGAGAVEVVLGPGEVRALRASDFRDTPEEPLAAKGGEIVLRSDELGIALGAGASRLASVEELVSVRYAHRWDAWALGVEALAALGVQHTSAEDVHLASLGGDATLEHRWRLGAWSFAAGGGGEADVVWQSLTRTDAARVAPAGYPTKQSFRALAPGPLATARLRFDLSPVVWTELAVRGAVLFPELDGSPGAMWSVRWGLGAGASF